MSGRIFNMQYVHTHMNDHEGPKGTLALQPLTKDNLHNMFLTHSNQIMMNVGLSITSPSDAFIKSVGRTIADQRVVPRVVNLKEIRIDGTKHVYNFGLEIDVGFKKYYTYFRLVTVAESDYVKLISAGIHCTS